MSLLTELPIESFPEGGVFSSADDPRKLTPFGDWSLTTFLHAVNWEWCVTRDGDRKALEHSTIFTSCLRAGDGSWGDFTVEFDVRQMRPRADTSMDEPFNTNGRAGVMFRYQTLRLSYALFLENQTRVVLYLRDGAEWTPLAQREMSVDPDRYYRLKIDCRGDRIRCWMDGEPLFDVTDTTIRRGRIAVYANTLSRFGFLRAETDGDGAADSAGYLDSERAAAAESARGLARPVLWKRIPHPDREMQNWKPRGRLALDISPTGKLEGALVTTRDRRYAPNGGWALVAVDTEGEVRWSHPVSREAYPRVWDLDGDGRQEVICYDGPVIKLLDIDTGAVKLEAPTPPCNQRGNRAGREDQSPYVPLWRMYPANVRGKGRGRDLVLMDLYTAFWVLNDRLELEWWRSREHGHDLGIHDIDNDGRDEILCGYTMFDHDGAELWSVELPEHAIFTHDHVDHIVIDEIDGDTGNGPEIALTAGNAGFFLLDTNGNIRARRDVGHAQALTVGRYRPDLPGKQVLVGCLWGNPGARAMFTGTGEKLWTFEPDNANGYDLRVRWVPGRDLFLLVSTPAVAGFYDGFGRLVMPFPDAHLSIADRPFHAADFTGNGLEDFVIQGDREVLVYTQGGL